MKAVDAFFKVVTICFFNSNNAAFYRHSGGWMAPSPHNKKLLAPTNSDQSDQFFPCRFQPLTQQVYKSNAGGKRKHACKHFHFFSEKQTSFSSSGKTLLSLRFLPQATSLSASSSRERFLGKQGCLFY